MTWLAVNIIALSVALVLLDGLSIHYAHPPSDGRKVFAVVLIGALLGVINKFVRPIVTILAIPAIVLTLGFALLLVNAASKGLIAIRGGHYCKCRSNRLQIVRLNVLITADTAALFGGALAVALLALGAEVALGRAGRLIEASAG